MTTESKLYISLTVTGLGEDLTDKHLGTISDTITGKISPTIIVLADAEDAQEIDLSVLDSVRGLMIKALDYDTYIDLDYDGETFNPCLKLLAGEDACWIPNIQGDVYFLNVKDDETPSIEISGLGIAN